MFENKTVKELKQEYDKILTKRINEYLLSKDFGQKSVAAVSDKADSYKMVVTERSIVYLTNADGGKENDRSQKLASQINYGISYKALTTDINLVDYQGLQRTRILIKILTRNYINQIIKLISQIRDRVGKSSQLVNKLSRVMLDIVNAFYICSMRIDTEDAHKKYQEILTSSNSYIENASAQLFTLNQASDILQSTANELSKGKIDENTLETLNTCLDEAITQLSDTIKKLINVF